MSHIHYDPRAAATQQARAFRDLAKASKPLRQYLSAKNKLELGCLVLFVVLAIIGMGA